MSAQECDKCIVNRVCKDSGGGETSAHPCSGFPMSLLEPMKPRSGGYGEVGEGWEWGGGAGPCVDQHGECCRASLWHLDQIQTPIPSIVDPTRATQSCANDFANDTVV